MQTDEDFWDELIGIAMDAARWLVLGGAVVVLLAVAVVQWA